MWGSCRFMRLTSPAWMAPVTLGLMSLSLGASFSFKFLPVHRPPAVHHRWPECDSA
jgi:hypothetical protein